MAANEQQYSPQSSGGGPGFRVINVPPDGSITPAVGPAPDVEVVMLAERSGDIVEDFRATRRDRESNLITQMNVRAATMGSRFNEQVPFVDRRGALERGTTR